MKLEFRLKQLLERNGLGSEINYSQIGKETNITRSVITSLYENKHTAISFTVLERLCEWLRSKHVKEDLPGALFGFRPSGLLLSLLSPGLVKIYLGEYLQRQSEQIPRSWVSRADAQVASLFVELLSSMKSDQAEESRRESGGERAPLQIQYEYVPSHFTPFEKGMPDIAPKSESTQAARAMFKAMRKNPSPSSNILIGSQRANYLVELFVAEMFGCKAFVSNPGDLPFYLYKPTQPGGHAASCFGGDAHPPAGRKLDKPGIYYRQSPSKWEFCPSKPNETDAGIVIVRRDPGCNLTDMAVFGYSGRATAAMGEIFRRNPDRFWVAMDMLKGGFEAKVFVCKLAMRKWDGDTPPATMCIDEQSEVIPLKMTVKAKKK